MKIKSVKKWDVEPRDGKSAYSVTFEEHHSTPVDYFSTIEPKIGDVVEGKVGTSEKGRPTFYLKEKFVLDRRQALIIAQTMIKVVAPMSPSADNLEWIEEYAHAYSLIALKVAERLEENGQ